MAVLELSWQEAPSNGGGLYWYTEWIASKNRWAEVFLVRVSGNTFDTLESNDDTPLLGLEPGWDMYVTKGRGMWQWLPFPAPPVLALG